MGLFFGVQQYFKRKGIRIVALKKIVKKLLHCLFAERSLRQRSLYVRDSYSQEGEDLLLLEMLENMQSGFYIDIGAHHPTRFSNTALFYELGWRGVNIEASPDLIEEFHQKRKEDINLCTGVGLYTGTMPFYVFDEQGLNTFDSQRKDYIISLKSYNLLKTINIPIDTLKNILDSTIDSLQHIDLLMIDVEGLDLSVLQSNDWDIYRPTIVMVEQYLEGLRESVDHPIVLFMESKGYKYVSKTYRNLIFKVES